MLDPTTYVKVITFVWYHYDVLLTLGDEIEFVWLPGWTWSIGLFLLIRLLSIALLASGTSTLFLSEVSTKGCRLLASLTSGGGFILAFLVSVILQARIYVMYHRNRLLLWINAALCTLTALFSVLVIVFFFPAKHEQDLTISSAGAQMTPCYSYNDPRFTLCLVPPLVYVIYLTLLSLWKLKEYRRSHPGRAHGALMELLVQSSVAYLALIVAAVTTVICLWTVIKVAPVATNLEIMVAAVGIGGTRLIITLRKEMLSHPPAVATEFSTIERDGESVAHVLSLPGLSLGWELSDLRTLKARG
ncbi:hypothetical protein AURDEDRAFT_147457 [Auricularia subglabra TFB-10046 SS5]|nr:hypothetical protein AURDEDRAFT_147457 [Auricularia subglabra TFB-10046 SS5]